MLKSLVFSSQHVIVIFIQLKMEYLSFLNIQNSKSAITSVLAHYASTCISCLSVIKDAGTVMLGYITVGDVQGW